MERQTSELWQMLRVLSQLAADNVLAQPTVLFCKLEVPNFLFSHVYVDMVAENKMYQHLKKICKERVRRMKSFWAKNTESKVSGKENPTGNWA